MDDERFEHIEQQGVERWLESVRQELTGKSYRPRPLLRVWIPKANGGQRPLGIPTIRDRVIQMAVLLVIGPIFDEDLLPQQYGFRPGRNAKMALRQIYYGVTQHGLREVVDADLADYFNTIPHGALMRCVSRRIADGTVLGIIRLWLESAVIERLDAGEQRTTVAKDNGRGTPQGGIVSPLLANLYFRRFLLAWQQHGYEGRLKARVVNYADDFVILCPRGQGQHAMAAMQRLMERLGLTVNAKKTRIVALPDARFDFLGYTVGRFFGRGGRPYWGTAPSQKAIKRLLGAIHDATSSRWSGKSAQSRVEELNPVLRGWAAYFDQGPVIATYRRIQEYTERRLRHWLMRRSGRKGKGYRRYPDEYLYNTLGLMRLPQSRTTC